MRRSFAALLAVLAAVSALAGCGTKKPGGTKTSDDGYTAEYVPEISRGDYNGASVTVMCRDPEMAWGEMAVISDEQSTAVLGDAAYRRNKRLENDYNVKLNFVTYNDETASGGSFYRTISDNLSAYDDICDICIPGIMDAATLASAGAFVDLSSGDVPHLDLEKPWWNKTLNDSMRILNRQYFAISDALLNDKLDTYVMFFNKTLFADTLTGNAEYRDAAIRTAEWAYDTMYLEIGKYVSICPDHVNVVDKESAIYAMYCFSTAYDLTGEEKYREALEHAAVSAMSFVYVYDYAVPYSAGSDYDAVNVFKNGGVIGQSVIATGWGAVDAYAACTYFDFFDYWVMTGDSTFLDFAKFIQNNTKITASDSETGWYLPGMNLEACNVSGNVFSTAGDGVWLPWISHSFVDPIADMRDRYGNADVFLLSGEYQREKLLEMRP